MNDWEPIESKKAKDLFRTLEREGRFRPQASHRYETYYLGSPEFKDAWPEIAAQLNKQTQSAFKKFCTPSSLIYALEPWHTSYQFGLQLDPSDWQYDVIGGKADSVYFVTENCRQGTYFSFEDSTFTIFGEDMLRGFSTGQIKALKYLSSKDGKSLLPAAKVPHLARHKHLFL